MPFALTDEEKKQGTAEAQTNISGASTSFNVPGQSATAGPAAGPKKSGQFQNIQKYLAANQGAGEQIGQKIAGKVESTVGEAQQAGEKLAGEVSAPTAYDPNKFLQNFPQATEEEKTAYKQQKETGGYSGPQDVYGTQGYGGFQTAKSKAEEVVGQAGTEAGQQTLLKDVYARPSYTKGATALDQSLLSQSQGGQQAITGIAQKFQPIVQALGGYQTQAEQDIAGAQAAAAANKAAFAPAEAQAQQAILSPIEQRAAEANKRAAEIEAMRQDISDLNLTPETMAALGLTQGQRLYGANLGQFISPQLAKASVQNIATTQERQRYNDLLNFLGTNADQLGLGQASYEAPQINAQGLAAEIGKGQAAMTAKLKEFGGTGDFRQDTNQATQAQNQAAYDVNGLNQLLTMGNSGHVDQNLLAEMQQKYPLLALESGPGSQSYLEALKASIKQASNSYQQASNKLNQFNQIGQMYGYNQQIGRA